MPLHRYFLKSGIKKSTVLSEHETSRRLIKLVFIGRCNLQILLSLRHKMVRDTQGNPSRNQSRQLQGLKCEYTYGLPYGARSCS